MFAYSLTMSVYHDDVVRQQSIFFEGTVDLNSEHELDLKDASSEALSAAASVIASDYMTPKERRLLNPMAKLISSFAHRPHEQKRDNRIREGQKKWMRSESGIGPPMSMMNELDSIRVQITHHPHSVVRSGNIREDLYSDHIGGESFRVSNGIGRHLMKMVRDRLEYRGSTMTVPEHIVRCGIVDTIGALKEVTVEKQFEGS